MEKGYDEAQWSARDLLIELVDTRSMTIWTCLQLDMYGVVHIYFS